MKSKVEGALTSGSGRKVTSRKQAVAVALNEARYSRARIPKEGSGETEIAPSNPGIHFERGVQ
jgi:hypothetical protein